MPDARPNVIVFFTDQQRWDTAGAYGNPLGLTPNFDRIARRGTFFEHAFTPQPVCAPARAALQTGRYPTSVGCYRNGIALPGDASTIARWFASAGYRTGYIGKWHLASGDPVPQAERGGYQTWLAANALEWTSRPYDTRVFDNDCREIRLPGYRTDALVDAAIRYIDTTTPAPFFLFLSLLEPHHQNEIDQYVAPDGYEERYRDRWCPADLRALVGSSPQQLAGYLGTIKRIDEGLGRLLDGLKSLRLDESTIVVYTTDHGNHFRTRNKEYKRSCHEASIRIPLAIQGPSFDERGVVNDLATLLDVPTMLADAAGLETPSDVVGRRLHNGRSGNSFERVAGATPAEEAVMVQISESEVGRALRTRRWKYSVTAPGADPRQTGSASRYVERYLYDLESDPAELHNLVADSDYRGVRAELRQGLLAALENAGEQPAEIVPWTPA